MMSGVMVSSNPQLTRQNPKFWREIKTSATEDCRQFVKKKKKEKKDHLSTDHQLNNALHVLCKIN
jgi:hypothetical protein